jgi:catechol 2,3-dioxygenase-like lactoylglutathione lyase family enzyme
MATSTLKSREDGGDESPRDAAGYAGIHHFGFMVDDVDATCRKLEAAGGHAMTNRTDARHSAAPSARSYYEIKYRGPDGQELDVTETGWIS